MDDLLDFSNHPSSVPNCCWSSIYSVLKPLSCIVHQPFHLHLKLTQNRVLWSSQGRVRTGLWRRISGYGLALVYRLGQPGSGDTVPKTGPGLRVQQEHALVRQPLVTVECIIRDKGCREHRPSSVFIAHGSAIQYSHSPPTFLGRHNGRTVNMGLVSPQLALMR